MAADGVFHLFDVTRLNEAPRVIEALNLKEYSDNVLDFAVSPDGRMAAAAYSGEDFFRLWDMATLQPVETRKSFLLGVNCLSFSPNSRRLAVGSGGQEAVKLWDTETWQEVLTLGAEGTGIVGLKFSPDGRYLLGVTSWAIYNQPGYAHLWFAPTLAEIEAAEAAEKQGQHP
jgi:WD40 repeat protein